MLDTLLSPNYKVLELMPSMLTSDNQSLVEQTLWCLSNISGSGKKYAIKVMTQVQPYRHLKTITQDLA